MLNIGQSAGKSYAYILGVYLGDGSVSKNGTSRVFRLTAIDKDFVEKTSGLLQEITGKNANINQCREARSINQPYVTACYDRELCNHLQEATEFKTVIPDYVKEWPIENKIAFVEGLMDSEGFVATDKRNDSARSRYFMGYKSCDVWVPEFIRVLESIGIKIGKVRQEKPRKEGYKVPTAFNIKMQSWVDSGCKFGIKRKQDRVDAWAACEPYTERSRYPRRLTSETTCQASVN
jgi:intein-encoded DNA endonuclease-like protein